MNADQEKSDAIIESDGAAPPVEPTDALSDETLEAPQVAPQEDCQTEPEDDPFAPPVVESDALETPASAPSLDEVVALLKRLQVDFERKLKYNAKKDEMIDNLHAENVEYKKDLMWSVKRELVESFIAEIDDVEKRWKPSKLEEPIPSDYDQLAAQYKKLLKYVCEELPDNLRFALESRDVFAYSSQEGVEFDPRTQRSVRTTPTDRPELNKTIKPLRPGYRSVIRGQETIIRPELVELLKYTGAAPAPSNFAAQDPPRVDEPDA